MSRTVEVLDLGLMDYQEAWDLQEELFKSIVDLKIENRKHNRHAETPNYLLFCEHPPVFTLGKSGDPENLLLSPQQLEEKGIQYYHINRGGDITYHGPGQLVGYPLFDLDHFFTDIHRYLRTLEEAVILTLGDFGIPAGRIEGLTGVWIDFDEEHPVNGKNWDPRKICAFGVKSSRWVTMHGLALNVNANLEHFSYIVPCGIDDKAVTSMEKELGKPVEMEEVKQRLLHHLKETFDITGLKTGTSARAIHKQ